MKCQCCKNRVATQRELVSVGVDEFLDSKTKKVHFIFGSFCKTCSLEIGYNQETMDEFLNCANEAIACGAEVFVHGNNTDLYNPV